MSESDFFNKVADLKFFSCQFWEIFRNTFFTEHLRTTAPQYSLLTNQIGNFFNHVAFILNKEYSWMKYYRAPLYRKTLDHVSFSWYMARFFNSEHCWKFCQHRKRKTCSWLLKNYASNCWRIMPLTAEQSCQ